MYIYKESEIPEAKGAEKKRRIFWNEKCHEICKNEKYNSLNADETDKLLHEEWRLHKAGLLDHQVVANKIQKIPSDNPEIVSKLPSARAVKSHTITKNFERLHSAKKAVEKSRLSLNELRRPNVSNRRKLEKSKMCIMKTIKNFKNLKMHCGNAWK